MSLDRGEMTQQETSFGHDESVKDAPGDDSAVKEIAGKSPTQIAFSRLRQDKVAFVCSIVIVLLVLVALFAPLITRAFGIFWDVSDPDAPNTTDVLAFDGYPKIGPPFHSFTWDHPLGRGSAQGLRQPRLPGLRAADLAHRGPGRHGGLHDHRGRARPHRRLLARLAGPRSSRS